MVIALYDHLINQESLIKKRFEMTCMTEALLKDLSHEDQFLDVLFNVLYRIASNKRRGRSFNFLHFLGAFIQGRRLHEGGVYYKIQRELQFYISTSMISSSSSIRKTVLYYL